MDKNTTKHFIKFVLKNERGRTGRRGKPNGYVPRRRYTANNNPHQYRPYSTPAFNTTFPQQVVSLGSQLYSHQPLPYYQPSNLFSVPVHAHTQTDNIHFPIQYPHLQNYLQQQYFEPIHTNYNQTQANTNSAYIQQTLQPLPFLLPSQYSVPLSYYTFQQLPQPEQPPANIQYPQQEPPPANKQIPPNTQPIPTNDTHKQPIIIDITPANKQMPQNTQPIPTNDTHKQPQHISQASNLQSENLLQKSSETVHSSLSPLVANINLGSDNGIDIQID